MDALINVVLPVFGIILTGYLAGRCRLRTDQEDLHREIHAPTKS
jgi:predicted permease